MSRHVLSVHYVDVLPMLGFALVYLWLWLSGISLRGLCADVALTLTGYLRRRPDPAVEAALRTAFAALDRDLAEILGDRTPTTPLTANEPGKDDDAGCLPTRGGSEGTRHRAFG